MKYIDADKLKAEIDKRYTEYRAKMKTDDFTYYEGMADALDLFEQFLDSLPEQPVEGLEEEQTCKGFEEEFRRFVKKEKEKEPDGSLPNYGDYGIYRIARHFAEWGAEHLKGWHSVEEFLPEIDEEVIVLADRLNLGSLYAIAIGHIVDKEKAVDYDGWNIPGVKFWMPMPKIPNEK